MSISKVKNYQSGPYYDDFDETKNYHRIMFRPGYAVQARELTQMQTALQAQIDKHGQYSFPDGGRVLGGKATLDIELDYIKLTSDAANIDLFVGKEIVVTGNTSKPTAKVLAAVPANGSELPTLMIKYLSSTGAIANSTFAPDDILTITEGTPYNVTVADVADPIGKGSAVHLEEGVYFVSGTFIHVPAETLVLEAHDNSPSAIVGLQVLESVIDSSIDASLLDNATGTPNTSAPGATRYNISTTLIKEPYDIGSRASENYITLLRIKAGIVEGTGEETKTVDTELSTRLARRTREESGDYVVRPFVLDIKANADESKVDIGVEPSVAYVQGYRAETLDTKYITIDKPRADSIGSAVEVKTTVSLGNYVKLVESSVTGTPSLPSYETVDLKLANDTIVGSCKIRGIRTRGDEVQLYILDVVMNASQNFSNVIKVVGSSFYAEIAQDNGVSNIYGTNAGPLLYSLPYNTVKSAGGIDGSIFDYQYFKAITNEVSAGQVSFSAASNESFPSDNDMMLMSSTGIIDQNGSHTSTEITYTGLSAYNAQDLTLVVRVNVSGASKRRIKTAYTNSTTISFPQGTNKYALGHADIIDIVSIVDANSNDVTNQFILDNGQRDQFYEYGSVKSKAGASVASGNLTITYRYYQHSAGDYITVNSYQGDYADIPSYSGKSLRDVIDFRPIKEPGTEFATNNVNTPWPSSTIETNVEYYLPRIDKLYITRDGKLNIAKGVPSTKPVAPVDVKDSLTLYNIAIKPYVFDLGDIVPKISSNTRYTMEDISKLDKRLKTLEYYTALSLLEQNANNTQITDSLGNARLKNGILVDSFRGHSVGDASNVDYAASIDRAKGSLRPKFDERNVDLIVKPGDGGSAVRNKSIVTLPFTSETLINQPYASYAENVNPYDVFTWGGVVELSPDTDEWKDTDTRPDVIIDEEGNYDQLVQQAEEDGILGTVWNEWETNWTGQQVDSVSSTRGRTVVPFAGARDDFLMEDGGRVRNRLFGSRTSTATTTITTTTNIQSRTGIRTDVVPEVVQKKVGTRIVDISFVPFMRSRKVFFKAQLLKPNTRVYAFFNGEDISSYIREEAFVEFAEGQDAAEYKGATSHPDSPSNLITDSKGKIEGSFIIPSNSTIKFKTGTRSFRLSDDSANVRANESTFAETQYHAQGLLETSETTIISTKVPKFVQSEVSDERTLTNTQRNTRTTWVDPLAQTFLITEEGGIFISSLELFFKTKDNNIPLRISIRSVENGIPTQIVVPGSDIVVDPSNVNLSENGSAGTTVNMDYPVYLEQDQEYAIVLMAQSNKYTTFVAEMGGQDLFQSNLRIAKQPYNGVFFTSQNASTWTPEQNKDLKFKVNRCKFTGSSATLKLVNNELPAKKLILDAALTTNASNVVKVTHKNHGMYSAAGVTNVVISGASTFNGVDINGTHQVSNQTHDSYEITLSGQTATAAGYGGGANISATEWRHIDLANLVLGNIQVPGTIINSTMSLQETNTVGTNQGNTSINNNIVLLPNKNIQFERPYAIRSGSSKTCEVTLQMVTDRDTLSPVIDLNRSSLITVQNIIDDVEVDNEEGTDGGEALARYITKRVQLVNLSSNIDVIMDVFRPSNATVDLYYKTAASDSELSTTNWTKAIPTDPIPSNVMSEVTYEIEPDDFSIMVFKIVMKSANSSTPPEVSDFRAIASL